MGNTLINDASVDTLKQPFDYEQWKTSMDKMFSSKTEDPLKRSPSDEKYLQSLKEKIKTNIEKSKKNFKNQEVKVPQVKETKEQAVVNEKKDFDEYKQLKLKEKERKRKKQDAIFQQKVEENKSKVVDMSLKSQKLEKISEESEREIKKIKDMAKKLVTRSVTNENDFNEIFLNIDNLENVIRDTGKKTRKSKKKEALREKSVHEVEVHWTEEDSNKWTTDKKKEVARVTSLLSALKTAAQHGASSFVSDSIQNTIKNCKQMQEEAEQERRQEKIDLLEKQKQIEEKSKNKKLESNNSGDGGQALKQHSKNESKKEERKEDKTNKEVPIKAKLETVVEPKKIAQESKDEKTESSKINVDNSNTSFAKQVSLANSSVNDGNKKAIEKESNSEILEIPKAEKVGEIDRELKSINNSSDTSSKKKDAKEEKLEIPHSKKGEENAGEQKSIDSSNNVRKKKGVEEEMSESQKMEKPKGEKFRKNVAEQSSCNNNNDKIKKFDVEEASEPKTLPKSEKEILGEKNKAPIQECKSDGSAIKTKEAIDKISLKNNFESLKTVNVNTEGEKGKLEATAGSPESKTDESEAEVAKMKRQEDFLAKMREEEQNKKKLIKEKIGKQLRQIEEDKKTHYKNLEVKKAGQVEKNPIPASPSVQKELRMEKKKYPEKSNKEKEIKTIESNSNKLADLMDSVEKIRNPSKPDTKPIPGPLLQEKSSSADTTSDVGKQDFNDKIQSMNFPKTDKSDKDMHEIKISSESRSKIDKLPSAQEEKIVESPSKNDPSKAEVKIKPSIQACGAGKQDLSPSDFKVTREEKREEIEKNSSKPPKAETSSKKQWPKQVSTVNAKSFIPQNNQKNEIEFLKIGSPSQVRKAVLSNVNMEKDLEETEGNVGYKISKIPTTDFEIKLPIKKKDNPTTPQMPRTGIEVKKATQSYVDNASKYSETKQTRTVLRSPSLPRPPPPSFKPPPPPSFKPPPPPPMF